MNKMSATKDRTVQVAYALGIYYANTIEVLFKFLGVSMET